MISKEQIDKLFGINESMRAMGLEEMTTADIRNIVSKTPLAPMAHGPMNPQGIPVGGFQGNAMFPNRAGSGLLQAGQQPPPAFAPSLDPRGQLMGQPQTPPGPQMYNSTQAPVQMAQAGGMPQMGGMPGQQGGMGGMGGMSGFDTHIHIGSDGQVNQINLKRAIQKARMQRMGGMA